MKLDGTGDANLAADARREREELEPGGEAGRAGVPRISSGCAEGELRRLSLMSLDQ